MATRIEWHLPAGANNTAQPYLAGEAGPVLSHDAMEQKVA